MLANGDSFMKAAFALSLSPRLHSPFERPRPTRAAHRLRRGLVEVMNITGNTSCRHLPPPAEVYIHALQRGRS